MPLECGDWKSQRSCGGGDSGCPQNAGGWDRGNPHRNGALGATQDGARLNSLFQIPWGCWITKMPLGRRPSSLGIWASRVEPCNRWWVSACERRFSVGVCGNTGSTCRAPHGLGLLLLFGCLLGISVWAGDKKQLRLPPHPNSPAGPALLVGTAESRLELTGRFPSSLWEVEIGKADKGRRGSSSAFRARSGGGEFPGKQRRFRFRNVNYGRVKFI